MVDIEFIDLREGLHKNVPEQLLMLMDLDNLDKKSGSSLTPRGQIKALLMLEEEVKFVTYEGNVVFFPKCIQHRDFARKRYSIDNTDTLGGGNVIGKSIEDIEAEFFSVSLIDTYKTNTPLNADEIIHAITDAICALFTELDETSSSFDDAS